MDPALSVWAITVAPAARAISQPSTTSGGVATVATSDDQRFLAQTTRTHNVKFTRGIDIRSEGGCLALQKLMSRDQIDHGATASNPVDAVELALLGNCLFDQIVCVHIQFLSCLARNQ